MWSWYDPTVGWLCWLLLIAIIVYMGVQVEKMPDPKRDRRRERSSATLSHVRRVPRDR